MGWDHLVGDREGPSDSAMETAARSRHQENQMYLSNFHLIQLEIMTNSKSLDRCDSPTKLQSSGPPPTSFFYLPPLSKFMTPKTEIRKLPVIPFRKHITSYVLGSLSTI